MISRSGLSVLVHDYLHIVVSGRSFTGKNGSNFVILLYFGSDLQIIIYLILRYNWYNRVFKKHLESFLKSSMKNVR